MPIIKTITAIEGEVVEVYWLQKNGAGEVPGPRIAITRVTAPPKATIEARSQEQQESGA